MIKFRILIFLSMIGLLQAQTSHNELSFSLLKQLQASIQDSTAIDIGQQALLFNDKSSSDKYLSGIYDSHSLFEQPDTTIHPEGVAIILQKLSLSINSDPDETYRNTSYVRQLELYVKYQVDQSEYLWQGRFSDKLSGEELSKLLDEYFPTPISGDYREDQPAIITIMIMTLGILSLVAALYFIRT